jgi:hypothetical protein
MKETIELKKLVTSDKTIVHYISLGGVNKFHNWDGPAYIPQGNKRLAEYYLFGIKYSKEEWLDRKKDVNGVPFYKTSVGKSAGARV